MHSTNAEYYRQRAAKEREAAKVAASSEIAAIHEQLALEYLALAIEAETPVALRSI